MTASSLSETLNELNALCQLFTDADASLKKGKMADLTGVDKRVAAVCQTVQESMPEQQKEFLPELTVLINLLNVYEQGIKSMQFPTPEGQDTENAHP